MNNGNSKSGLKLESSAERNGSDKDNNATAETTGTIKPAFNRYITPEKKATSLEEQIANDKMEAAVREMLLGIGEDPDRDGLKDTPGRVRRSMAFLTDGYTKNVEEVLGSAVFEESYDEVVIVRDIEMYSMCEHHMLPFFGKCHIAYIPDGKIVGLSKLPRIVDVFSRRLQVQERMTTQIAHALDELLHPKGVAVVSEAYHLCMMMRGVQKQNSSTVASCMLGAFRYDNKTRQEFLDLIQSKRNL